MEVNKERAQAALDCLNFNKHLKEVHVTSDLHCFPLQGDAIYHARSLEDKTVDVFTRDEGNGVELNLLDTLKETNKANTIPDAHLANAKRNNKAKDQPFDKVKKAAAKDKTPKYGTEEQTGKSKVAKPGKGKNAAKAETKPADENTADQQQSEENPA